MAKLRTDDLNNLFAYNSEWSEYLQSQHFYPRDSMAVDGNHVAVFNDLAGRRPLILIDPGEPNVSDSTVRTARRGGFPLVVAGLPDQHIVLKIGSFDNEVTELPTFPTWMPRYPRTRQVPRSRMLLPFQAEQDLRAAFASCHDAVYKALANDPASTFDLLLLVIAAKVRDEQRNGGQYEFANVSGESPNNRVGRFNRLITDAANWLGSAAGAPPYAESVSPALASRLLSEFEDYSLTLTAITAGGTDILGTAYETIVGATFRGELGSYFTPRTIADFMAQMIDVHSGRVLDPACGSAGLLLAVKRSNRDRPIEFYGNDLNPRMVRAAKVNFLLHGLSPSHILQGDGLQLDRMIGDTIGDQVADGLWWEALRDGPFDAVLANPPFAGHEADPLNLDRIATAARPDGSVRSLNRTIPFVETIVASLRLGGVAGLVLPTSILNAEEDSFERLRELLLTKVELLAIIGLPEKAFVHTDCGVHGCLVFLRRVLKPRNQYRLFVDWARHLGYDRLGRYRRENDFPGILERFRASSWPAANTFSSDILVKHRRWDPAWLHVIRSLPTMEAEEGGGDYVRLTDLLEVRDARFSKRDIRDDSTYRFFEVADADLITGRILAVHETTGFELRKKGRIRNRTRVGDVLLPNHRDSLIAKGAPTGRSAVLVTEVEDDVLTTDRFLVLTPHIDPELLRVILNSAGVRRQIVAQCRGAASLDIRERTLTTVLVPRELIEGETSAEILQRVAEIDELRTRLEESVAKLTVLIENSFEYGDADFRPAGSAQI